MREPNVIKKTKVPFCSRVCYWKWMRVHSKETPKPWAKEHIIRHCEICGKTMSRKPSYGLKYDKAFCSTKCHGKWRSQNIKGETGPHYNSKRYTCTQCDKEIDRSPFETKDKMFCSQACHYQWASGSNSPSWQGGTTHYYGPNWRKQKSACRKRDGNTCQNCGLYTNRIHAHHIIPFRLFDYIPDANENYLAANELSNLICLCASCHKSAEHGRISFQPKLV